MPSNRTYRIQNAVIVLVILMLVLSMLCMCGCCRKQYTQHTSSVVLKEQQTIDTYLFKGIKHFVYDTTIVVISDDTGDTIRTDHRSDSRYFQEDNQKQENTQIAQNDTTTNTTEIIIKNELNKIQRFFFVIGILSVIIAICYIAFILFKLFKSFSVNK